MHGFKKEQKSNKARKRRFGEFHGRMARDGHGLPQVSPGPAMPCLSTTRRWATPETASWAFQGWVTHRAASLRPSSTPLDTPRRTPMANSLLFKSSHSPSRSSESKFFGLDFADHPEIV
jgi:hypothetical protein